MSVGWTVFNHSVQFQNAKGLTVSDVGIVCVCVCTDERQRCAVGHRDDFLLYECLLNSNITFQ